MIPRTLGICEGRLAPLVVALLGTLSYPVAAKAADAPTLVQSELYWVPNSSLIDRAGTRAELLGVDAGLQFPIELRNGIELRPGASYHFDGLFFDPGVQSDLTLHFIGLNLGFAAKLSKKWKLKLSAGLGLAGDFDTVDAGLFRGYGYALATHKLSSELSLGGGLYASYAFGSFLPLPAFALIWKPSKRFSVDLLLPDHISAIVHLRPRIEILASLAVAGQKYAIRKNNRCDAIDTGKLECIDNLAFSMVGVELTGAFRSWASLWIEPYLGMTLYRRFDQYTAKKSASTRARSTW